MKLEIGTVKAATTANNAVKKIGAANAMIKGSAISSKQVVKRESLPKPPEKPPFGTVEDQHKRRKKVRMPRLFAADGSKSNPVNLKLDVPSLAFSEHVCLEMATMPRQYQELKK